MSYSRRQLYAMGEPLGDSATYRKADGGLILGGGGGGSSSTGSQTNISELPEWARGYAKDTLYQASQLTDPNQHPYQTYDQQRIAGFSPLQQQAQQNAANMQVSNATGTGQDLAQASGVSALNAAGNKFTDPGTAQSYMNPYLQQSLAPQMAMLQEQQGMQQTNNQAQATQAGAFGGSRMGVQNAQQNQANQLAMSNLVGQGYNNAYNNAQGQFNADQSRGLLGLQTASQAAGQLGQLGQNEYQQNYGINQLQNATGAQQQAQQQQGLSQSYQDFLNQKNYPYQQLSYMSDMVRGLPLGQASTSQIYQANPSALQTVGALGLGAYGLKQAGLFAKGGSVKHYDEGGITNPMDDSGRMTAAVTKLTEPQLQQILQHPASAAEKQAAQLELATRASEKHGLASAYNAVPYSQSAQPQVAHAAKGGIMHFGVGGGAQSANDGNAGDAEAQEAYENAQQAQEDAQDDQSQGAVDTSDPTVKQIAGIGTEALLRDQNRQVPDIPAMNDPKNGAASFMGTIRQLAGPDPYSEIKTQIANMATQSQQALQQGKGVAALHAMGALLQGPNFMRALGGAGSAFADNYGQAMQAHRQAQNAQMQMSINVASGQRAENLGLAKDAISSFQAAQANKINMFKAEGERDQRLVTASARLARAVAPPKAAAPVKPTDQQQAQAAMLRATQNPQDKQAQADAASWAKVLGMSHPAPAAAAITQTGANDRAATTDALTFAQQYATAAEKANTAAEAVKLTTPYIRAQRAGDTATMDQLYNTEYNRALSRFRPTGQNAPPPLDLKRSPAAPAAPATPAAPAAGADANITLPPAALSQLKPNLVTTFANGQSWTIKNGKATRVN